MWLDGLAGEDGPGRREAEVHDDDEYQRDHRPEDAELRAAGDHLRQAELGPLGRVQGHDRAAEEVADQESEDCPQRVSAEQHGQGAVDDGRDLHVRPEPQRELLAGRSVTFIFRNEVDGAALDAPPGGFRSCRSLHARPH